MPELIITLIIILIPFYWLMIETNWLRVRLLYGVPSIIMMAIGMIFIAVGLIMSPVFKQRDNIPRPLLYKYRK